MNKIYSETYHSALDHEGEQSHGLSRSKSYSSSNQFFSGTFRWMLGFLLIAGISGIITILFPSLILPALYLAYLLPFLLVGFAVNTYLNKSHYKAGILFAISTVIMGAILGPILSLMAFSIQNGLFIISSVLAAIFSMVFMLHNYALIKSFFNLDKISLIGTFLITALTGIAVLLIMTTVFTAPLSAFFYGLAAVGLFSFILTHNVYRLKTNFYTKPLEAAMKTACEIPHFFVDIFVLLISFISLLVSSGSEVIIQRDNSFISYFFKERVGSIFGVLLVILSLGYLEEWLIGPQQRKTQNNNIPPTANFNSVDSPSLQILSPSHATAIPHMNSNILGESYKSPLRSRSPQNSQRFFEPSIQVPEFQTPPEPQNYYDGYTTEEPKPSAPSENAIILANS